MNISKGYTITVENLSGTIYELEYKDGSIRFSIEIEYADLPVAALGFLIMHKHTDAQFSKIMKMLSGVEWVRITMPEYLSNAIAESLLEAYAKNAKQGGQ